MLAHGAAKRREAGKGVAARHEVEEPQHAALARRGAQRAGGPERRGGRDVEAVAHRDHLDVLRDPPVARARLHAESPAGSK